MFIHNFYINDKTCDSPENKRKKNILNILKTAPTNATDYDKNGFAPKVLDTRNTSVIVRM